MASADPLELLHRHLPQLIYDSQETYFADAAAEWTDAPTNVLKRSDGSVVAAATPRRGQAKLSLDFLRARRYANKAGVRQGDLISRPNKDYLESYRPLHVQERYRNRVYGHAVEGKDNVWLQYWFFYYYNAAPLVWIGYGKHEGDWEMIQLRIDDQGRPDLAVYAQHKEAGVRQWADVEKTGSGDTPVVYVARGAHASYFAPGEHWNDRADGKRPGKPLVLEVVTATTPGWIAWPGRWGDTEAESDLEGQSSPTGPSQHGQWTTPDSLIPRAGAVATRQPVVPRPPHPELVMAERTDDKAQVTYAFPGGDLGGATSLLVTVNSPDDPYPPATYTLPITESTGTVDAPLALVDGRRYEIDVSAQNDAGAATSAVRRNLPPATVKSARRTARRAGTASKRKQR